MNVKDTLAGLASMDPYEYGKGLGEGWLTGWKRIAFYLGVSISTTKRYHYRFSMPIRRTPGGRPVSFPLEVDLWLAYFDEIMQGRREPK